MKKQCKYYDMKKQCKYNTIDEFLQEQQNNIVTGAAVQKNKLQNTPLLAPANSQTTH